MRKRKSTTFELVQELEFERDHPRMNNTPALDMELLEETIAEAKAGEYHDYKNNKYVCGKIELSSRLRHLGLAGLALRVERGEFDEEADEEDKKRMRESCPENLKGILGL